MTEIILAGVGGQGLILAGQLIAHTATLSGLEVATSEVHGMAQRGGSVCATVRYGAGVLSSLIPQGEGDIIVAFEELEALRYLSYLRMGALALINEQRLTPHVESLKIAPYPPREEIDAQMRQRAKMVLWVPAHQMALRLGQSALLNSAMLGALSAFLDFSKEHWLRALHELVPPKTIELNQLAFAEGANWAARSRSAAA